MWRLINCFRGLEQEHHSARPVVVAEPRAIQYQAPSVTTPPRAASISSCDEDQDFEHGTLLPKRHTPDPAQTGQTSSAGEVDVGHEAPRHHQTGSGASSRSRPDTSSCKPPKLVPSKVKQYSKEYGLKPEQEFDAVAAGTAGLLGADEDDDFCPTCLEAYDEANPKIFTRCGHHFHMPCIYEWLERKDTCPICESKMVFEEDLLI